MDFTENVRSEEKCLGNVEMSKIIEDSKVVSDIKADVIKQNDNDRDQTSSGYISYEMSYQPQSSNYECEPPCDPSLSLMSVDDANDQKVSKNTEEESMQSCSNEFTQAQISSIDDQRYKSFLQFLSTVPKTCSPTVCGTVVVETPKSRIKRKSTEFRWSIDQIARLNPCEFSNHEDMPNFLQVEESESDKFQKECDDFFSQKTIAPSPDNVKVYTPLSGTPSFSSKTPQSAQITTPSFHSSLAFHTSKLSCTPLSNCKQKLKKKLFKDENEVSPSSLSWSPSVEKINVISLSPISPNLYRRKSFESISSQIDLLIDSPISPILPISDEDTNTGNCLTTDAEINSNVDHESVSCPTIEMISESLLIPDDEMKTRSILSCRNESTPEKYSDKCEDLNKLKFLKTSTPSNL